MDGKSALAGFLLFCFIISLPLSVPLGPIGLIIPFFFLILAIIAASIVIINQYERGVKFRLGKFVGTLNPGVNFVIPFLEWVRKVDIRVKTIDIPGQQAITKDNVSVRIDGVVYYKVIDPAKAILNVKDVEYAIARYAQTVLRDIVGKVELDELLSEREKIAEDIRQMVDKLADEWGVDVPMVKLQDVAIPESMKRAMARQAEAERERRAVIIKSEGEVKAAENFAKASEIIAKNPAALHLRTLQTLVDISSDPSNKILIFVPFETLKPLIELIKKE